MNNWFIHPYLSTGLYHKSRQLPCQDALRHVNTSKLVLAVAADGVSFLSNSHIAANAAAESLVAWFQDRAEAPMTPDATIRAIREDLIPLLRTKTLEAARAHHILDDTLDCNLSFAAILPAAGFAIWGVLGDGAVCVFSKDRSAVYSSTVSETANGTETIMQPDAAQCIQLHHCTLSDKKLLGFMVTTDGLENEIYLRNSSSMCKRAEYYFNAMLSPSEQARKSAVDALLNELSDDFDDDRSLAIISNATRTEPVALTSDSTWLCTCGCRNPMDAPICGVCYLSYQELYSSADTKSASEPLPDESTPNNRRSPRNSRNSREHGNNSRLSKGQLVGSSSQITSQGTPDGAIKRTTTPQKNNDSQIPVSNPRIDELSPDLRAIQLPSNDTQPSPMQDTDTKKDKKAVKDPGHSSMTLTKIAAIAAAVCFLLTLITVVLLHVRISKLETRIETLSQTQHMEYAALNTYYVNTSAYLWNIENGNKTSNIDRLQKDTKVVQLNDQVFIIEDVTYIYVRTPNNQEGWFNLASLTPADSSDAHVSHTGE